MAADMRTGWERENRTHFDEIVINYDRARPEYPASLFEDVIRYAGPPKGRNALEIGAGTGKATRPFLDAGYAVTTVEPGAHMAAFLRARFGGYKGFNVIVSAFEDAVLEDASFDLVYAASAFHWVDAEIGCPKALRLLKSGGTLALLRYNFNVIPADGEALSQELRGVYERHFRNFYAAHKKSVKISHALLRTPAKTKSGYGFEDLSRYGFEDITMKLYDAVLTYDPDAFIALLDTLADHRNLPENDRAALYAGIKEAIRAHGGLHKVDLTFQLYMGRKP